MEKQKLYIRTDANEKIAMGHVMRCLSIAEAFHFLGGEVEFLVADRYVCDLLEKRQFPYRVLHSSWKNLEGELGLLRKLISFSDGQSKGKEKPKVLVDSYQATEGYLRSLGTFATVIYLDDINRFAVPAAMVVNYVSSSGIDWEGRYGKTDTLVCAGWQYTPLRLEFADCQPKLRKRASDVLITTGGSDPYGIAGRLAEKLLQSPVFAGVTIHVVAGRFCQEMDTLQQMETRFKRMKVYQNIDNMAQLMSGCDFAISAGGTTLFELFACGVPVIAFGFADNQLESLQLLSEHGALYNIGDIRADREEAVFKIVQQAERFCQDYKEREQYAKKGHCITDGRGAFRIAEAILGLG